MSAPVERYHGLDLARAIFMLLGIVYHCAAIFQVDGAWLVNAEQTHRVFDWLADCLRAFRMHAFFIIAGFFFCLVVEKYGERRAAIDRTVRLMVPLLFAGFVLNGLTDPLTDKTDFSSGFNYIARGEWLGHLWFLGNLVVYNWLSLLLVRPMKRIENVRLPDTFLLLAAILLFPALAAVFHYYGRRLITDIHFFVSFFLLYYYLPFYLVGMVFYFRRAAFMRLLNVRICSGLFLFAIGAGYISHRVSAMEVPFLLELYIKAIYNMTLAISIMGFINFFARESGWVTRIVNASYTIYVLHQPLIVCLFPLLVLWIVNPFLFFALLSLMTFVLTFFCHEKIIAKSRVLLFLLNGIRPRKSTPEGQAGSNRS